MSAHPEKIARLHRKLLDHALDVTYKGKEIRVIPFEVAMKLVRNIPLEYQKPIVETPVIIKQVQRLNSLIDEAIRKKPV